jgi:hypothetical protein
LKKLVYLIPEVKVVKFEMEDVITTSPNQGLNFGGNVGGANGDGPSIGAGELFGPK